MSANSRDNSIPGLGPGDLEAVSSGVNTILLWTDVETRASRLRCTPHGHWSQVFRAPEAGQGHRGVFLCFSVCVLFVVT